MALDVTRLINFCQSLSGLGDVDLRKLDKGGLQRFAVHLEEIRAEIDKTIEKLKFLDDHQMHQ